MSRQRSRGICGFCGESYDKAGMTRHLKACKARKVDINSSEREKGTRRKVIYHVLVKGSYDPDYWLHLEVPADATLEDLDLFLRRIWLECCGHLSAFMVNGATFSSDPMEEFDDRDMYVPLRRVAGPGDVFDYVYDFGSSTNLSLKVLSTRKGKPQSGLIEVMARNVSPEYRCDCGKPATAVCCECVYDGEGWLCDDCAPDHECGEDMLLPVVNSPRVGICCYTG